MEVGNNKMSLRVVCLMMVMCACDGGGHNHQLHFIGSLFITPFFRSAWYFVFRRYFEIVKQVPLKERERKASGNSLGALIPFLLLSLADWQRRKEDAVTSPSLLWGAYRTYALGNADWIALGKTGSCITLHFVRGRSAVTSISMSHSHIKVLE